jgi:hypothetical protein
LTHILCVSSPRITTTPPPELTDVITRLLFEGTIWRTNVPERLVETNFEAGERKGVRPGLAVQDGSKGGAVHLSQLFDCPESPVVYSQLQLFDKTTESFRSRITGGSGGPGGAMVGWSWALFARHCRKLTNHRCVQTVLPGFCHTPKPYLSVVTDKRDGGRKVAERIERYVPEMPQAVWEAIRGFVNAVVSEAEPLTTYDASALLWAISGFARWTFECGMPLNDKSAVFDLWRIEEYIAHACPTLSESSRGNRRSQLLRVAEIVSGPSFRGPRLRALAPSDPSRPYSEAEVARLRRWAKYRPAASVRQDAIMLFGLGAGAGLAVEDLLQVRVKNLHESSEHHGLAVTVPHGRRARTVPILKMFSADLAPVFQELSETSDPFAYVFRQNRVSQSKNGVTNFVSRNFKPESDGPRPSSQRLRATWIVTHLTLGTPVVP